eukprot:UN08929
MKNIQTINNDLIFSDSTPTAIRASIDYCELMAIHKTIILIDQLYINYFSDGTAQSDIKPKNIRIISDSMVSVKWITGIWMPKEKRLYNLIIKIRKSMIAIQHYMECPIILQWVNAHKGTIGNEYADILANVAVDIIQNKYTNSDDTHRDLFTQNYPNFITNNWSAT